MSKKICQNKKIEDAVHIVSSKAGELIQHDFLIVRGKGEKESHVNSYDAIFTFDDPIFCKEDEVPMYGGYFLTDEGLAEITQLVCRFNTSAERQSWVRETFRTENKNT